MMRGAVKIFLALIWANTRHVQSAPRQPRLSLAESPPAYFYRNIDGDPSTYAFGYDVSDFETGNTQFRAEQRYPNGTVSGNYGYIDPTGTPLRYRYVADENGYRVFQVLPSPPTLPVMNPVMHQQEPVTWSRTKRPNTEKTEKDLMSKLGFQRRNYNIANLEHGFEVPSYSYYNY